MSNLGARRHREDGVVLFAVMLVLALLSALAVTAVSQSGAELAASGRTRGATRALYAADAGIEIARTRLAQNPPNANPINLTLPNGWTVESRARAEAERQALARDDDYGPPPDGYSLEGGFASEFYLVNITATRIGGGTTSLEAKLSRLATGVGGY